MDAPLDLLYTGRLRGDLTLLPRLYTFLRQLMGDGKPLLLDLGESCAPEVWPCAVTGGRSTLIALDAMGYHAANVSGVLAAGEREKLAATAALALVDDAHPHTRDGILFATVERDSDAPLTVILTPSESTRLDGRVLRLARVEAGQVGRARVRLATPPMLLEHAVHAMPGATPPHPTIAGTVDFIEREARYYERRREG